MFGKLTLILCCFHVEAAEFVQEYILQGGSKVIVHKPFGTQYYSAVVTLAGEFPGSGMIAHDVGRSEFIYVLDGTFEVRINEEQFSIQAGGGYSHR